MWIYNTCSDLCLPLCWSTLDHTLAVHSAGSGWAPCSHTAAAAAETLHAAAWGCAYTNILWSKHTYVNTNRLNFYMLMNTLTCCFSPGRPVSPVLTCVSAVPAPDCEPEVVLAPPSTVRPPALLVSDEPVLWTLPPATAPTLHMCLREESPNLGLSKHHKNLNHLLVSFQKKHLCWPAGGTVDPGFLPSGLWSHWTIEWLCLVPECRC